MFWDPYFSIIASSCNSNGRWNSELYLSTKRQTVVYVVVIFATGLQGYGCRVVCMVVILESREQLI